MKYITSALALANMSTVALASATASEQNDATLVIGFVLLAFYFFPTIIAYCRKHNQTGVFILNLLLGWTVLGWIVALIMACTSKTSVTIINKV